MKKILFRFLFLSFFLVSSSQAAVYYIRDGGPTTNCGSNWTNACDNWPASLERGATYYIADGFYSGHDFNDDDSSKQWITIKKAIANGDHGAATDWVPSYGDGQADFNGSALTFVRGYYHLDGGTRNASAWNDTTSYGFRVRWNVTTRASNYPMATRSHLYFKYMDVGGPVGNLFSASFSDYASFDLMAPGTDFYIGYSYMHNMQAPLIKVGAVEYVTVEYCYMGPNWSKETIRAGDAGNSNHWIIANNQFVDSCQGDPSDSSAAGCTAEIGAFVGSFDDWKVYGNVFRESPTTTPVAGPVDHSDGIIMSNPASNWKVYNNTFSGLRSRSGGSIMGVVLVGANNMAYNNIWYGIDTRVSLKCAATACSNNWCAGHSQCGNVASNELIGTSDPFVDSTAGNLRLKNPTTVTGSSPANNGKNLGAGYVNVDGDGHGRGLDGNWDIGAFEYCPTCPVVSPPPNPTSTPHPADSNSDFLMALNEATLFGACWKSNCAANATLDNAVRAGTLWNATANGQYQYNLNQTCPLCWEVKP